MAAKKLYKCATCNRPFRTQSALNQHLSAMKRNPGEHVDILEKRLQRELKRKPWWHRIVYFWRYL